jgi:hypothetical protein
MSNWRENDRSKKSVTLKFKKKLNPENKKAAVFMLRPLFITIIQLINKFRQATRHDHAPKNWS